MISACFQARGKVDDSHERFMMLVIVGSIWYKQSFMTEAGTLSYPGALLFGMSMIAFRTSELRTGLNSNRSSWQSSGSHEFCAAGLAGRSYISASLSEAAEAYSPTEVKKLLNSSASIEVSLVYSGLGRNFGNAALMVFHSDELFFLFARIWLLK